MVSIGKTYEFLMDISKSPATPLRSLKWMPFYLTRTSLSLSLYLFLSVPLSLFQGRIFPSFSVAQGGLELVILLPQPVLFLWGKYATPVPFLWGKYTTLHQSKGLNKFSIQGHRILGQGKFYFSALIISSGNNQSDQSQASDKPHQEFLPKVSGCTQYLLYLLHIVFDYVLKPVKK